MSHRRSEQHRPTRAPGRTNLIRLTLRTRCGNTRPWGNRHRIHANTYLRQYILTPIHANTRGIKVFARAYDGGRWKAGLLGHVKRTRWESHCAEFQIALESRQNLEFCRSPWNSLSCSQVAYGTAGQGSVRMPRAAGTETRLVVEVEKSLRRTRADCDRQEHRR